MDARRIVKLTVAATILAGMGFAGAGCDEDSNELQRLVVEVAGVNGGVPLTSGYLNAGRDKIVGTEDDLLPIDNVEVTFHARPYNRAVTLAPDAPFSYFHITRYDLHWVPLTPGSEPLADFPIVGGGVDVLVPVGQSATVFVMAADRYLKEQAFFPRPGSTMPLGARGVLTFYGHETGSDHEVSLSASFMANFVGVVIDD